MHVCRPGRALLTRKIAECGNDWRLPGVARQTCGDSSLTRNSAAIISPYDAKTVRLFRGARWDRFGRDLVDVAHFFLFRCTVGGRLEGGAGLDRKVGNSRRGAARRHPALLDVRIVDRRVAERSHGCWRGKVPGAPCQIRPRVTSGGGY